MLAVDFCKSFIFIYLCISTIWHAMSNDIGMNKRIKQVAVLLMLTALGGSSLWASVRMAATTTPYDRDVARFANYFPAAQAVQSVSIADVARLMGPIHRLPYRFSKDWKTPAQLQREGAVDCKGKSIALLAALQQADAGQVSLVIGLRSPRSAEPHAWLLWNYQGRDYILDPTFDNRPIPASSVRRGHYRADYVYNPNFTYTYIPAGWLAD